MLPENNQILNQEFVDDLAKQVYNTSKILYTFSEEDRERIIRQLVTDFLKQYIKTENNVVSKESSGDQVSIPE